MQDRTPGATHQRLLNAATPEQIAVLGDLAEAVGRLGQRGQDVGFNVSGALIGMTAEGAIRSGETEQEFVEYCRDVYRWVARAVGEER